MLLLHGFPETHYCWRKIVPALAARHFVVVADSGAWPRYLLAQPAPFPERLIAAAREDVLRFVFESWTGMPTAIDAEAFAHYLDALTADTIAAMCGDYRARFWLGRNHDAEDRQAGRRIECSTLVVTGAR